MDPENLDVEVSEAPVVADEAEAEEVIATPEILVEDEPEEDVPGDTLEVVA
jgi:hypothetical protein